jgi:Fe2+ or Zn2+ uptake regulation protein
MYRAFFARVENNHELMFSTMWHSSSPATTVRHVRSPTELTTAFRGAGLKVTPQRQLLFRLLHANHTHPSADALFAAASSDMPGISLRTVYQTLNDLVAMGELQLLALGGGSMRFDPNTDDHHHLVCTSCGEVRDVYLDGVDCLQPDDANGFDVSRTSVVFHGNCERCRS